MRYFVKTLTLSFKYQVVIPKILREVLHLTPGQQMQVIVYENRIELVPLQPIQRMKGFLQGIDTAVSREKDNVLT
jgi:AbrB family looped-hinge helix DNA binding protein